MKSPKDVGAIDLKFRQNACGKWASCKTFPRGTKWETMGDTVVELNFNTDGKEK